MVILIQNKVFARSAIQTASLVVMRRSNARRVRPEENFISMNVIVKRVFLIKEDLVYHVILLAADVQVFLNLTFLKIQINKLNNKNFNKKFIFLNFYNKFFIYIY